MSHTLESIAKLAGVSRGTVSRIINKQPGVKEEVRKKVEKIIEETGYQPNAQARVLAGGTTENIGVVVFGDNPFYLFHHIFYEVLQGIQNHSTLNSYDLLLFANRIESDKDYWKRIADRKKIDGLIIMGEYIRKEYLQYYHNNGLPFVLVGKREIENLPLHCVTSNYKKGAYEATHHLIKQGRRQIVYIRGILNSYHEEERTKGYQEALREADLLFDPSLVINAHADQKVAYMEMKKLLRKNVPFNAVFAGNDLMAFGAVEAIKEHGLQVPNDISVVGYDDIQTASTHSPSLTTVRQDKITLGTEASKLLVKLLTEKTNNITNKKSTTVIVENELIIRNSSIPT